jgi:acetyltransferase-like isoleucine patch superfamily enzyme
MGGVVVNTGSVIGENVILNTSCSVDHHNRVAAHSHLGPGVHTCGNVSIGEAALLGVSVSVLPGRSVGSWATVGAGGVVTRDVPEHATVAGVPARVICQTRSK